MCVKWRRNPRIKFSKHTAGPVHSVHTGLLSIYYGRCPGGQIKREVQGVRGAFQWELAAWTTEGKSPKFYEQKPFRDTKILGTKAHKQCCEMLGLKIWYKTVNVKIYHSSHLTLFMTTCEHVFSPLLEQRAEYTSVLSLFLSILHSALLRVTPIKMCQMN